MFNKLQATGFQVESTSHAEAILTTDFPTAIGEVEDCLLALDLPVTEIIGSGGGEAKYTQRLRHALTDRGWPKTTFTVQKTINGKETQSTSHEVDHVRELSHGTIALEIEWNNKDPFFDRDLENFKRLHADGAISAGIIITRGSSLQASLYDLVLRFAHMHDIQSFDQLRGLGLEPRSRQIKAVMGRVKRKRNPLPFEDAWANHFVKDKFGAATTHWDKLKARIDRGVGNPCPLALIGLPSSLVTFPESGRIEAVNDDADSGEGEIDA